MDAKLTLGPHLFHWPADKKRDFYARIADEAPIDTVYLGEVICSKRAPFFDPYIEEAAERLERGGKTVVISSLAEVMLKRERRAAANLAEIETREVEVNNSAELYHISGRAHRIGQYFNAYNEVTMRFLAAKGASHFCLPAELPGSSVALMAATGVELGTPVEVQVFGRASLALSARCYHARAHGRHKDNCQFVCEDDSDGMALNTVTGQDFLTINGIQTLSRSYVSLLAELGKMMEMGVSFFRLVPHSVDMVAVAEIFTETLQKRIDATEAEARLSALSFPAPFSNGFWYGQAGHKMIATGA
jgi:O2-independent ubiquinone biosynthesis protein UbiV